MEYQFYPSDSGKYATNLRVNNASKQLTWDVSRGVDTLVVQTPYGQAPVLADLCGGLGRRQPETGRYMQLAENIWARYVPAEEKVANCGCGINREASRYTVLACEMENNVCKIYEPYERGMNKAHRDIQLKIHIDIQKHAGRAGTSGRRGKSGADFYRMTFPDKLKQTYMEGDLCYKAGNLEIPVTLQMIEQGTVYIKTRMKPVMIPLNSGIMLI